MSIIDNVASESAQVMIYKHPKAVVFIILMCVVFVGGAALWASTVFAEKAVEHQVAVMQRGLSAISLQILRRDLKDEAQEMRERISYLERLLRNGQASPDQIKEFDKLVSELPEVEDDLKGVSLAYRATRPKALEEWDIRDRGEGRR